MGEYDDEKQILCHGMLDPTINMAKKEDRKALWNTGFFFFFNLICYCLKQK